MDAAVASKKIQKCCLFHFCPDFVPDFGLKTKQILKNQIAFEDVCRQTFDADPAKSNRAYIFPIFGVGKSEPQPVTMERPTVLKA